MIANTAGNKGQGRIIPEIRVLSTDRGELADMAARLGLRGKMDLGPVIQSVTAIIADVREQGDKAVVELTARFDRVRLQAQDLRVSESEISEALEKTDFSLLDVMRQAAANIRRFHEAQLPADIEMPAGHGGRISLEIGRAHV